MATAKSEADSKLLQIIGIEQLKDKESTTVLKYKTIHEKIPNEKTARFMFPDPESFKVKRKARKGEWLAEQKEGGQTFKQFQNHIISRPCGRKKTIYLIPLGFEEEPVPKSILKPLSEYAKIFFDLPIKIGKQKYMVKDVPNRINEFTNNFQVDASAVLKKMEIPMDAFCVAGITMCDLYPRESWNFVFGLANLSGLSGVYSLARYLSNFGTSRNTVYNPDLEKGGEATILRRACKVMCHEIGHMYGLRHCIHFECLMNGSNHLEEADKRPTFLCPLCLNKLYSIMKFDVEERYKKMLEFWKTHGLPEEVEWLEQRLAIVSSAL
ncbi:archaemetzincin-2-like [Saccostrea cucullata]|uniref:archaemetzincin-2-like n=1 Tax=Saccostrea cuccullata TaxID=36930 RepID=UPI002ED1F299